MSDTTERAKALMAKITPGPWVHNWYAVEAEIAQRDFIANGSLGTFYLYMESENNTRWTRETGDFIAEAPTLMAALVAENDALRARIAAALNLCRDEVRAALSEETPNAD